MHREQHAARLHAAFIALRFILRHSHADQSADESTHRPARAQTRQRAHDGTSRDERSDARDGQRADAGQQTECAANYASCGHARGGALRRLGVLLVGEIFRALVIRQQHRNVVARKSCRHDSVHCQLGLWHRLINAENGCIFSCHVILLWFLYYASCRRLPPFSKCLPASCAASLDLSTTLSTTFLLASAASSILFFNLSLTSLIAFSPLFQVSPGSENASEIRWDPIAKSL